MNVALLLVRIINSDNLELEERKRIETGEDVIPKSVTDAIEDFLEEEVLKPKNPVCRWRVESVTKQEICGEPRG